MSRLRQLCLSLSVVLLAGCGGGEDAAPPAAPVPEGPLPKDEFIRQADAICLSGDTRIEAAADDLATRRRQPSAAELRRLVSELVVPGLRAEVAAIESLPPPVGSEDEVRAILAATEQGIAQIEADPEGLTAGPPPALEKAGRLARRFGSRECGVQ